MKVMLTSSLGGSSKVNGIRVPSVLIQRNGLLDNLKSIWITDAKVLIICADPSDYEKNDSVCACLKESLPMSGLSISHIDKCDGRNPNAVNALESIDVLILAGGHVPTQNKFMDQLRLKERLMDFHGIVVAWSAGSMNCADTVYAGPELEGEAIDPLYERWITGLGLTDINIFPHFQSLKDDYLDADKFKLHSLPGGGVEDGEDVLTALRREVYEETGCACDEIQELGIVAENRASLDYTQINYYFVVTTTHTPGENHLTEAEQDSRTVVEWHTFDEMGRLINEQEFDRVQGKYLKARDVAALKAYAQY